jgi:hypothetical protein
MGMKFRWIASAVLGALVVGLLVMPSSVGAIKAGTACKKAGVESIQSGRKFTCIKQGKKFVWNKGVVVKAAPTKVSTPTPISTPSATPISTPSATPTPTPTFTPPPRPMNWTELVSKSEGITYWAWKLAQERKASPGEVTTKFFIHIGPNTVLNTKDPEGILRMVAGFYSNSPQVKEAHATFYDFEDVGWAQEIDRKYSSQPRPTEVSNSCRSKSQCDGGNAYVDSKLVGFSYMSSSQTKRLGDLNPNGTVLAHEYFHTIQMFPLLEASSRGANPVWMPDWIREGSAQWFSTAIGFDDFDLLINYQKMDAEHDLYRRKASAEYIGAVLSTDTIRSENGWLAYNVGSKVMEALVVLKGVDSILEFYTLGAKGQSFETAFQSIYGITWAEAKPILTQAISNHYK